MCLSVHSLLDLLLGMEGFFEPDLGAAMYVPPLVLQGSGDGCSQLLPSVTDCNSFTQQAAYPGLLSQGLEMSGSEFVDPIIPNLETPTHS